MTVYKNQKESIIKLSIDHWNDISEQTRIDLTSALKKGLSVLPYKNKQTEQYNYNKYILTLSNGFYFECFNSDDIETIPNALIRIETVIKDSNNNTICSVTLETFVDNVLNENESLIPILPFDENNNIINTIFFQISEQQDDHPQQNPTTLSYSDFNNLANQGKLVIPYNNDFSSNTVIDGGQDSKYVNMFLKNNQDCLIDVYKQVNNFYEEGVKATAKYPNNTNNPVLSAEAVSTGQFLNQKTIFLKKGDENVSINMGDPNGSYSILSDEYFIKETLTAEDLNNMIIQYSNKKSVKDILCVFSGEIPLADVSTDVQLTFSGGTNSKQNSSFVKLDKSEYKLVNGVILTPENEPFTDILILTLDPSKVEINYNKPSSAEGQYPETGEAKISAIAATPGKEGNNIKLKLSKWNNESSYSIFLFVYNSNELVGTVTIGGIMPYPETIYGLDLEGKSFDYPYSGYVYDWVSLSGYIATEEIPEDSSGEEIEIQLSGGDDVTKYNLAEETGSLTLLINNVMTLSPLNHLNNTTSLGVDSCSLCVCKNNSSASDLSLINTNYYSPDEVERVSFNSLNENILKAFINDEEKVIIGVKKITGTNSYASEKILTGSSYVGYDTPFDNFEFNGDTPVETTDDNITIYCLPLPPEDESSESGSGGSGGSGGYDYCGNNSDDQ